MVKMIVKCYCRDDLYVIFDKLSKNKTFFKKMLDKSNELW